MALLFFLCLPAHAQDVPVLMNADQLTYDDNAKTVTADGDVQFEYQGRTVRADKITYTMNNEQVVAQGSVKFTETDGSIYYADKVQLTRDLKDGYVKAMRGVLADGSRVRAVSGTREDGNKTTMHKAHYTPCEPCKKNPNAPPIWQLSADKVTHYEDEKRVAYNDATFDVYGVPLLWMPYFSHPDGTVDQKSGFLAPTIGWDSALGGSYSQDYYWAISPSTDLTTGMTVYTDQAPLMNLEARRRFKNAAVNVGGTVTYADRVDEDSNGVDRLIDDELRGHIEGNALWDINQKWRAGTDVKAASDEQYLRQYNLDEEDVLESRAYVERFDGRDYAYIQAVGYQDTRIERQVDQPYVLPEAKASFVGAPNKTLGGRWDAEVSTLGLMREGEDQDVARGSVALGWKRQDVLPAGVKIVTRLRGRGDIYDVNDPDLTAGIISADEDGTVSRALGGAHVVAVYPLVKPVRQGRGQILVEPTVSFSATAAGSENDVPNEDSQDLQVNAKNLFEADRFAGYDRIEDDIHAAYGTRIAYYDAATGGQLSVFGGQSYRIDGGDTLYPEGSGLSDDRSDYVGEVNASLSDRAQLNYRLQLDGSSMASKRHEVLGRAQAGPVGVDATYVYSNALEGTDLDESREQARAGVTYHFSPQWRTSTRAVYDLGTEPGLRKAAWELGYIGQCISFAGTVERNLTDNASGDRGTELMFRLGLKNLGEFETSGISLSSSSDEDITEESISP